MVKEAVLLNGISELAIMKMDILDGLKTIKICVAYKYKGKLFKEFPQDLEVLQNAKPVYKEVSGWSKTIDKSRCYRNIHPKAKAYLKTIQDILGVKVTVISVGSSRDDTIFTH